MCDLETSRIGAPYIYDISNLRVKNIGNNSVPTSQINTMHVDYKDTPLITFRDVIAICCQVIPYTLIKLRGKNMLIHNI